MKELGMYIHIPFCKAKCHYCDFTSFSGEDKIIDRYIENMIKELNIYKNNIKNFRIKTIFIGGGTPSHIDVKYIEKILKFIRENFNTENLQEVSIETNPGTINFEKAKRYKDAGIDRISMGVQTLNNSHLKNIGRIHSENEVYESLEILKRVGFTNINLDFIFGLPDESIEDVEENLRKIEKLKVSHISYYGLILEEGTPLYDLEKNGKLNLVSDIEEREMYYLIKRKLKAMGYHHYEISNFAIKDHECKHNILYWEIEEYIGIGLSSHSFLDGRRYWNRDKFTSYFSDIEKEILPIQSGEDIKLETEISEFTIMGLRLIKGIDKELFKNRFHRDIYYYYKENIKKHIDNKLLVEDDSHIKLTDRGMDLSNQVEVDFLLE